MAKKSKKKEETLSFPWLVGGVAVGVGAWYIFRKIAAAQAPASTTVDTVAMPFPPIATPTSFPDLISVNARREGVKQLYQAGKMSPEQALSELSALDIAADRFLASDPAGVAIVKDKIQDFRDDINDFVQFQREQKGLTGRPPFNTTTNMNVRIRRIV